MAPLTSTSVQQIIDSGVVDERVDTATLYETRAMLEFQLTGLRAAQFGAMGQARITQHQKLLLRIQTLLEQRHGSDGMTHLNA